MNLEDNMGNAGSGLDEPVSGVPVNTPLRVIDMRDLQPFIDDTQGTLRVLNTGGGLVKHLGKESKLCQYIYNGDIQMKFFAGGEAGQVADVTFPGMGTQKYVVKATKELKEIINVSDQYLGLTIQGAWDAGIKDEGYDYDIYIELNGGDPNRVLRKDDRIIVPEFAEECLITKSVNYKNTADPTKTVTYPKGSYLCTKNSYSEYVNSLLVGELVRSGQSINFINTFNFATCSKEIPPASYIDRLKKIKAYDATKEDRLVVQYTFMEKIDGDLEGLIKKKTLTEREAEILFVQVIHAIATYQAVYKLQHNDLHMGNVFYLKVKPDTMWHDRRVSDANYFSYRVGNTLLYLPSIPYIAKVADWGLSVKYSTPIVGDKDSANEGYPQEDDPTGPWIANFYSDTYDLLYAFNRLFSKFPNSKFLIAVGDWLIGDVTQLDDYIRRKNDRPVLSKLLEAPLKGKTAANLLRSPEVMGEFMRPPPAGAVTIELGTIADIPPPSVPVKSKAKAKSPKSKAKTAKQTRPATRSTAPAKINCAQLTSLSVNGLAERLAPLALSPATLTLFQRNRVTGQTLVDFYDIDQYRSLNISEPDRIRLVEYVRRCTA